MAFLFSGAAGQKSMAQELLEELPGQFMSYIRSKDIKPLNMNINTTWPQTPISNHPI